MSSHYDVITFFYYVFVNDYNICEYTTHFKCLAFPIKYFTVDLYIQYCSYVQYKTVELTPSISILADWR